MNGINCIGFLTASFGLAVAARNTVRLLLEKGHDVSIADLRPNDGRSSQDHAFDHLLHTGSGALPHPINLFHCNPPHIGALMKSRPPWLAPADADRLNVCVPFWELTEVPESWIETLEAMDMVLCPSRFVEQAVVAACRKPLPHVRHYPQTAFLPGGHGPDRGKFGLPEQGVLFIVSFEMGSDVSRKNPWAAIDAFNRAFTPDDDAYLIVKLQHSAAGFGPSVARLREHAAGNPRIVIRDQDLGYEDVLSLYESCDCFISLHRSEGLGLGPMEAMLLGKPVMATAWSGNMDFMDGRNSCLVGYRLVPVDSPVYRQLMGGRVTQWADPDIDEAASWMRRLYENAALRREIGSVAQESMVRRQEECRKSDIFREVEEFLFRKQYRAAPGNVSASAVPAGQSAFFSAISALLKANDPSRALDLYYRNRDSFMETPELLRIDGIMRQVRKVPLRGTMGGRW